MLVTIDSLLSLLALLLHTTHDYSFYTKLVSGLRANPLFQDYVKFLPLATVGSSTGDGTILAARLAPVALCEDTGGAPHCLKYSAGL